MINLRRINLNLLTFFEALYQEKNLTAAAERISVSQPAMSNALSRLRATFNDQLFIRSGNQMEPTPRARRLAPSILDALAKVRDGLADIDEFDPSVSRSFNLGGVDHVDLIAVPELVKRHQGLLSSMHFNSVAINEDEYQEKLRTNQVDLIIDVSPPSDTELLHLPILHRALVPTVREGHPLAGKDLKQEDLLECKFAMLAPRESTAMAPVENYLREHGCLENIAVRVCHIRSLYDTIRNSDLVGFFPQSGGKVSREQLVALTIDLPPTEIIHYMIWHQFQTDDPGHKWLRAEVKAIYEEVVKLPDMFMGAV